VTLRRAFKQRSQELSSLLTGSSFTLTLPVLIKLKSSRSPAEVEGNEDKSGLTDEYE